MKLLLDTHTFLWLVLNPSFLTPKALAALNDKTNDLFLSDASIWEMAIKVRLNKLYFPQPFDQEIVKAVRRMPCTVLPITTRHVIAMATLPLHHRAPFDRMLVVQSQFENCTLVTHDSLIAPYGIKICW
ncbi:MAG: type II toxin-antitoxin system VapC family toxin [Phycisphaerales bacterium]|nr:type II toxin-antitoxin system VapC family toxin [Phycisphaerales bacterium]